MLIYEEVSVLSKQTFNVFFFFFFQIHHKYDLNPCRSDVENYLLQKLKQVTC